MVIVYQVNAPTAFAGGAESLDLGGQFLARHAVPVGAGVERVKLGPCVQFAPEPADFLAAPLADVGVADAVLGADYGRACGVAADGVAAYGAALEVLVLEFVGNHGQMVAPHVERRHLVDGFACAYFKVTSRLVPNTGYSNQHTPTRRSQSGIVRD